MIGSDASIGTELQTAMLLVGPTGAGKTPLGEMLSHRGLGGRRCFHFDFGGQLRALVDRNQPDQQFSPSELTFLRDVLRSGVLLEDQHFPLAARVFSEFLVAHSVQPSDLVVLNGLPRHVGQAKAMESLARVELLAVLECNAEVVWARIESDIGGDRRDRSDDSLTEVSRKLAWYEQRTRPLIDFYRDLGRKVVALAVAPHTTADALWRSLHDALGLAVQQ